MSRRHSGEGSIYPVKGGYRGYVWCTSKRVLVIGHVATRYGLDHYLGGVALEELVDADFNWRAGWEYTLKSATVGASS